MHRTPITAAAVARGAVVLCAVLLSPLAACDGREKVEATNESAEAVAKKVAAADIRPDPGRWESTVKAVKIDMPGMPPEMRGMMEKAMGRQTTFATCLTAEEAAQPNSDFFGQKSDSCTYEHFRMAAGTIDAKLTCKADGASQTIAMTGTYAPDSYDMKMDMVATGGRQGQITMNMAVASKRVGECTGKEET